MTTTSKANQPVYLKIQSTFPEVIQNLENLGKSLRTCGPIVEKDTHLVQLAAAAAIQSEGSVHSHVKRALAAGATIAEIEHSLILLISVIGFPKVAAALSWAYDGTRIEEKE